MPYIDPEREQFEFFKALPRDKPVNMLNLVKLKEKAIYADGLETTGTAAYEIYGREAGPIFNRVGGIIIWRGKPETMLIGPSHVEWDIAFVARYPTAGAFMEMVTDPEYRKVVRHRQAAVEDSRLLRCAELNDDNIFGG